MTHKFDWNFIFLFLSTQEEGVTKVEEEIQKWVISYHGYFKGLVIAFTKEGRKKKKRSISQGHYYR